MTPAPTAPTAVMMLAKIEPLEDEPLEDDGRPTAVPLAISTGVKLTELLSNGEMVVKSVDEPDVSCNALSSVISVSSPKKECVKSGENALFTKSSASPPNDFVLPSAFRTALI